MAFVWNRTFETGIAPVDAQHRELVDLINEAAATLASGEILSLDHNRRLLDVLFSHAALHFKSEEALMREHGLDSRHVLQHVAEHTHFVEQLGQLRAALESVGQEQHKHELGSELLGFLIHWLSFHILDVDQRMARQIALVAEGQPAAQAHENSFGALANETARRSLVAVLMEIYAALRERKKHADETRFLTDIDAMTGLPNRGQFLRTLKEITLEARAAGDVVLLLLVDVDDLTTINQTSGHAVADQLLTVIAGRLRDISRRLDLAARTGDDEFALVMVGGADANALSDAADRVFHELSRPIVVAGEAVEFSLSGGHAVLPDAAVDAEHLLAAAELALAAAKREGGADCRRYAPIMGQPGLIRSDAVAALRNAIRNGELVLHYQPQVSLHSGEIVGLEALVRWAHPTRGMVPPGQFIPLAEETGLIVPLGEWVIREALAQCQAWRQQDLVPVRVAVNLSARHFRQPDLPALLEAELRDRDIAPHLFELELTESVMMHDPARAIAIVDRLRSIGVKLSLDDFGTGYSSLAYLSRFAFDTLKIDQSFVRDITTNPVNASIAVATIAMAHKLGKTVIAEGVETEGQMIYLRRHDCDEMQGYFFSKPVAAEAIAEMLKSGRTQPFGMPQEDMPCLLLVDDEVNILNALKRLLRREGYRILVAESAAQGLELLAANRVEVILSDQRMPEMTGTEFLSRVKEIYPDTVRMVLSGYSELASVTEAVNRGAIYKYLSKPWHDEDLKKEVRLAFRHHKGGRE